MTNHDAPSDDDSNETPKKGLPRPDELQKDIENLIKKKYRGSVSFFGSEMPNDAHPKLEHEREPSSSASKLPELSEFNHTPKELKAYLDEFVIEQDDAKKALSIAVCDHYNFVKESLQDDSDSIEDYSKQNVLLLGPTGVGKTYLIRLLAEKLGVPFVKADATRFSETGYVGANVDDLIRDLVNKAGGDFKSAQFGIVYIDEADKLASPSSQLGRDVSGRGVQFGLLKLMEETEVDLRANNDMASQMQAMMEFQQKGKVEKKLINTKFILFIVSGAFTGLNDIIKRRINAQSLGIAADVRSKTSEKDYLPLASTQDLIDFGFEPEFVGRLPVRVSCQHLEVKDLHRILKESKGSILRQYQRAFLAYGIEIQFDDAALLKVAELAHEQKTGARALMTVLEKALRDYKFELPSSGLKHLLITKEVIENPKTELEQIIASLGDETLKQVLLQIREFESNFSKSYGMEIQFTDSAAKRLAQIIRESGRTTRDVCDELLHSYEHGLKLIQKNTGQEVFWLDDEVTSSPKKVLEKWIHDSYNESHQAEVLH